MANIVAGFLNIIRCETGSQDALLVPYGKRVPEWTSLEIQSSCYVTPHHDPNLYQVYEAQLYLNYVASDFGGNLDMRYTRFDRLPRCDAYLVFRTERFPAEFTVKARVVYTYGQTNGTQRHTVEKSASLGPACFKDGIFTMSGGVTVTYF